jgi:hypothetical protein
MEQHDFFIVGDCGGLPVAPYDTPCEVGVSEAYW